MSSKLDSDAVRRKLVITPPAQREEQQLRIERGPGGDIDIEFPVERPVAPEPPDMEVKAETSSHRTPVTAALADAPVQEEFRLLRAKVRSLDAEHPLRLVGVVSAGVDEGKSTIALGLARAAAQDADARVLLLEADLRHPILDTYLGLHRVPGLGEWLESGQGPICLRRVGRNGFHLLSAGLAAGTRPATLLGSERMARMLESARRSFDFVIVDCPPLAPVADAVLLQDLLDGFLFVVRERLTPWPTITRALARIKPERIRGVVLNDHQEIIPRGDAYGYAYER